MDCCSCSHALPGKKVTHIKISMKDTVCIAVDALEKGVELEPGLVTLEPIPKDTR